MIGVTGIKAYFDGVRTPGAVENTELTTHVSLQVTSMQILAP